MISDRTALDYRWAPDGSVFLVSGHKRDIELPGVILRPRKGSPPIESDPAFIGTLRIASPARAYLENMRPSRARRGVARTLTKREIEERLDELTRQGGETALLKLRDDARRVADELDMKPEFQELDGLIGGMLGTRDTPLASPLATARAAGLPYDPHRLDLFQRLHTELTRSPSSRPIFPTSSKAPSLQWTKHWTSSSMAASRRRGPRTPTMCWARGEWSRTPEKCRACRAAWRS